MSFAKGGIVLRNENWSTIHHECVRRTQVVIRSFVFSSPDASLLSPPSSPEVAHAPGVQLLLSAAASYMSGTPLSRAAP